MVSADNDGHSPHPMLSRVFHAEGIEVWAIAPTYGALEGVRARIYTRNTDVVADTMAVQNLNPQALVLHVGTYPCAEIYGETLLHLSSEGIAAFRFSQRYERRRKSWREFREIMTELGC